MSARKIGAKAFVCLLWVWSVAWLISLIVLFAEAAS